MKKVIYVAGPYRADCENNLFENIMRARAKARELWHEGWTVICPHANSMFMGDKDDFQLFLDGGLELVRRSDAIYMLAGFEKSEGSLQELALARELGKEIIFENYNTTKD